MGSKTFTTITVNIRPTKQLPISKRINQLAKFFSLLRLSLHTSPSCPVPTMIRKHIYTGALLVLLALQLIDTATASRSLLSGNRSCACPYSYMPVCGSDGRQYANRCMAECLEVTVTKENAFDAKICRNIAIDSIGPQHPQQQPQKPGSDRQTLPVVLPPRPLNMSTNSAALGNPPCRCPKIYLPVCGKSVHILSALLCMVLRACQAVST